MNKRILFILLLIAAFVLPANAVLKEDSLANSLAVLRHELISYHVQQNKLLSNSKAMSQEVFETMRNIMGKQPECHHAVFAADRQYLRADLRLS